MYFKNVNYIFCTDDVEGETRGYCPEADVFNHINGLNIVLKGYDHKPLTDVTSVQFNSYDDGCFYANHLQFVESVTHDGITRIFFKKIPVETFPDKKVKTYKFSSLSNKALLPVSGTVLYIGVSGTQVNVNMLVDNNVKEHVMDVRFTKGASFNSKKTWCVGFVPASKMFLLAEIP